MLLPEQPTRTAASELAAVLAIPPGSRWSTPGGHDQPCRVQTAAPSTGSWRPLLATVKTPSPQPHPTPRSLQGGGALGHPGRNSPEEKREGRSNQERGTGPPTASTGKLFGTQPL